MTTTQTLARYAASSTPGDFPANVTHEALRALVNWIGSPIGASRHDTVERALAAYRPFFGAPQASLLGRPERVDALHATLINGIASGIYDYDDTHLASVVHPTGPTAAALIALAEIRPFSGALFTHALALGIEVTCRLGNALGVAPAQGVHGWFLTSVTAVVGAAVACGKVLGLDDKRMAWAIGIAAARASGTRLNHGTMTKNYSPGCAGVDGLTAALLAEQGYTASERSIEGSNGLAQLFAVKGHPEAVTDALGSRFEILVNAYKPFPSGIVTHAAIDACQRLRRRTGLDARRVARAHLEVPQLCLTLCGNRSPRVATEATFSVFHWAAVGLQNDTVGIRHFDDAVVADPDVIALRDRIDATAVPGFAKDEAKVRVVMDDGSEHVEHVPHAIGGIDQPMTDAQLEAKLCDLVERPLGTERGRRLARTCWGLADEKDAAVVARSAVPS